jgi:flagellar biosynthetic protein FliO
MKTAVFIALLVSCLVVPTQSYAEIAPKKQAKRIASDEAEIGVKLVVGSSDVKNADVKSGDVKAGEAKFENEETGKIAGVETAGAATNPTTTASTGEAVAGQTSEAQIKAEQIKLPENQIPVLTGPKDTKKATGGGMTHIFITLGVLATALGAAIYGLKRMAANRGKATSGTKIKVLTQHSLGPKKNLAIIQVAGEAILIGVTDHTISMIKPIALIDDEFPEELPRNFNSALDEMEPETPAQDDFAMQGLSEIRDKVSTRLRSMKNF